MITDQEINKGLDEAFINAGQNAYFGDGFRLGVKFAIEFEQDCHAKECKNQYCEAANWECENWNECGKYTPAC
ncbi:MAG: hypothetical protein GY941_23595 [Planctomycetes bacterium]|nr:hypothetical protein [Planctomycetota bacterium]